MKLTTSVFLPSAWVTETLTPFFNTGGGAPFLYLLLLLFTSGAFIVFGSWLFSSFYYSGLIKAQQSGKPALATDEDGRESAGLKGVRFCLSFLKGYKMALIEKDILTFFRTVQQSSQLLLLFAIIIIYLFSIKALPVDWGSYLSVQLKYVIAFLNTGLVAFVITAIAARLVLPSVGNEGTSFWIIRVSPVSIGKFLWTKYIIAFFPLFLLAQLLIVVSNLLLGVTVWFIVLGIGTCAVLVASVTGLAVGIGAYSARFSLIDTDREQTGIQGTVYMISAFAVIIMTIMLEVVPTLGIFMKEVNRAELALKGWSVIALLLFATLLFNGFAIWMAMRMGEKRLVAME
jgi:ABC-2 type transport system permease protein